ncbi:putative zinc-binding oxidoreductase protein [Neofusicoccum parvum UCRNP2]|uniref:Zinc-binding oxidoreductase protein n=2 Tax=Neofusicoccum parvum TaxID=310453 RepID=A0ACB5RWC6_9PEZI|nr:putative zinc-binding oxidoreductase protein [Neofusicoccum parvum UCRNP2]GME24819.1 Zinc-binding oxidoreductase protein [Neofusicoccum parvum]
MKAIKIESQGKAAIVDTPVPQLRPDRALVKTVAVALNPTDWKHIHFVPGTEGCTAGCDFAGVVQEVGANVTTLKKGDRIAGWSHGGNSSNKEDGAFGEYLVAKEGINLKIPTGVSFEDAATLGVGITTVGQGLYQSLKLPLPSQPSKERFPVLVYGGSTATGALAVQFAKLSGLEVIATASPHNFDMLKSLGADAVFDYNSPTVGADIRKHTANKLYYAFDCIAEGSSAQICADALSSDEGKPAYSALLFCEFPRKDIQPKYTLGYTTFGETFTKAFGPGEFPASKEDYEFGSSFWKLTEQLLAEGKFKVHRPDVRGGGLEGVLEGLEELKAGKVSGKKLVYKIADA